MSTNELKQRFLDEIKLRAYDDKFVDTKEEKEILQGAINQGISLDSARSALVQVCEMQDFVLESQLDQRAKEMLEQFAANDGQIDKKEFDDTTAVVLKAAKGRLSESKCQRKVKEIVLANEWKIREGFLKGGSWFKDI